MFRMIRDRIVVQPVRRWLGAVSASEGEPPPIAENYIAISII